MFKNVRVAVLAAALLAMPALSQAAFIDFSGAVLQSAAGPEPYGFGFGTSITPDFYTTATSILEFTVTPAPGGDARVDLTAPHATYLEGTGLLGVTPTNLGVDLGSTPCIATAGVAQTCLFALVTNVFAPTFFDALEAQIFFDLTGAGAGASVTGRLTVGQAGGVPEPGTLVLFGAGVLAALRARRQTRMLH